MFVFFSSTELFATPVGLSAGIGTLGANVSVSYDSTEDINVRLGVNRYKYEFDKMINEVDYDVELELKSMYAMIDWYPWENNFRFSAGILSNSNQINGTANSSNQQIDFNGTVFNLADAGAVAYDVEFEPTVGYLGVGWGNAARGGGLSVFADLGLMYQGSSKVDLTVENQEAIGLSQSDIDQEINDIEEEIDKFKLYPVITIGFGLNL